MFYTCEYILSENSVRNKRKFALNHILKFSVFLFRIFIGASGREKKRTVIWTSWFKACKYFALQSHRCFRPSGIFLSRNVNPRRREADIALPSSNVRETTVSCISIYVREKNIVRKIQNRKLKYYTGIYKKKSNFEWSTDRSNIEVTIIYKRLEVKRNRYFK